MQHIRHLCAGLLFVGFTTFAFAEDVAPTAASEIDTSADPQTAQSSSLKELKNIESRSGIIIISAKNSLEDKLKGLELGSDDYLAKPFHLSELNARVHAIIRRRNLDGSKKISFNEIVLEPEAKRVAVENRSLDLTDKEYRLLEYFIFNKRRVLTKTAIAAHIWGDEYEQVSNYDFIYTHIKNLRKKLIDAGSEDYIKTVHGTGYCFTDN